MSYANLEGDSKDAEKALVDALRDVKPPTVLELGEYELGLLSPERHREITTFLRHHLHAARQLSELQAFLTELNSTAAETGRTDIRPQLLDNLRVLVAQMIPGDTSTLAPTGIRGDREDVYQAEEITIVVDKDEDQDAPGRSVLTGMILGTNPEGLKIQLWSSKAIVPQVTIPDEHGNFSFAGLEPGRYDLIIKGVDQALEIHVPDLMI